MAQSGSFLRFLREDTKYIANIAYPIAMSVRLCVLQVGAKARRRKQQRFHLEATEQEPHPTDVVIIEIWTRQLGRSPACHRPNHGVRCSAKWSIIVAHEVVPQSYTQRNWRGPTMRFPVVNRLCPTG